MELLPAFTKKGRRKRLREQPFPDAWRALIERNVPVFRRLSTEDKHELLGHVNVLLAEKHFEGVAGIEITDEIRLTIAAQAALLLLHRDTEYYPELRTIVVYPTGYVAEEERHLGAGIWEEGPEDRLGHTAEDLRAMVLSWDDVWRGAAFPADGVNLVFHEFAHQLDFEDLGRAGTPALGSRDEYAAWADVMTREFAALQAADEAGANTLLDPYGATDPAEFFAVATEAFFEQPRALRARHPELYATMRRYFKQDPESYSAEPKPAA